MSRIATSVGPLQVREAGSGAPALLWPSLFVDSRSWHRVESDLGAERHLVLIDGPGHGASGDPGHHYTLADCATAALEVLDALRIGEPVDWVGNAWGGHVGILAAVDHPTRVRSLVTIGTPIAPYAPAERRRTRFLLLAYRLLGATGFLQEGVAKVLLSPTTLASDPDAVTYVKGRIAAADRRMLRTAVESISLGRDDLGPRLGEIRQPTMFVTGTDDSGFTPDQARAAIGLVPDGRVAIVPDAAYLAPLEQPAEVVRIIRAFWDRLPVTKTREPRSAVASGTEAGASRSPLAVAPPPRAGAVWSDSGS